MDTARANMRIASSVFFSASWRRASSVKRSDAASAGVAALVISGAREASLKSGPALTVLTSRAGGGEAELSAELPGDAEADAGASGLAGGTSAAPGAAEVPPAESAGVGAASDDAAPTPAVAASPATPRGVAGDAPWAESPAA